MPRGKAAKKTPQPTRSGRKVTARPGRSPPPPTRERMSPDGLASPSAAPSEGSSEHSAQSTPDSKESVKTRRERRHRNSLIDRIKSDYERVIYELPPDIERSLKLLKNLSCNVEETLEELRETAIVYLRRRLGSEAHMERLRDYEEYIKLRQEQPLLFDSIDYRPMASRHRRPHDTYKPPIASTSQARPTPTADHYHSHAFEEPVHPRIPRKMAISRPLPAVEAQSPGKLSVDEQQIDALFSGPLTSEMMEGEQQIDALFSGPLSSELMDEDNDIPVPDATIGPTQGSGERDSPLRTSLPPETVPSEHRDSINSNHQKIHVPNIPDAVMKGTNRDLLCHLTMLMSKAESTSADKISVAVRLYENVDREIRALDAEINAWDEEELMQRALGHGPPNLSTDAMSNQHSKLNTGQPITVASAKSLRAQDRVAVEQGDGLQGVKVSMVNGPVYSLPIMKYEPLYCHCQQPSYGNMIACDNDLCEKEWFHLGCVGLIEAPKNEEWYCSICVAAGFGPANKGLPKKSSKSTKKRKFR